LLRVLRQATESSGEFGALHFFDGQNFGGESGKMAAAEGLYQGVLCAVLAIFETPACYFVNGNLNIFGE